MTTITNALKTNGIEPIEFLDILRLRNRFPEIDPDEILKLACAKITSDSALSRWRHTLLEQAWDKYMVPYHIQDWSTNNT